MYKILLFLLFIWPVVVCAQPPRIISVDSLGNEIPSDTGRWMPKSDRDRLANIRVTYKKPSDFSETPIIPVSECFKNNAKLESMFSCVSNLLVSNDEEFISFIPLHRFLTKADSISMQQSFPEMKLPNLNDQHAYSVRAQVLYSLGKNAAIRGPNAGFNWKEYVQYYADKDARRKFNADTAITYDVVLNDDEYYLGKYKYLRALVLQKKDRGFVAIYSFYTDKAKRRLAKYWKATEGILRYDD